MTIEKKKWTRLKRKLQRRYGSITKAVVATGYHQNSLRAVARGECPGARAKLVEAGVLP